MENVHWAGHEKIKSFVKIFRKENIRNKQIYCLKDHEIKFNQIMFFINLN